MPRLAKLFLFLTALITFAIPIERRHDKIFRFFSKTLKPASLEIPAWLDKKLCFYPTDLAILLLFFIIFYIHRKKIRSLLFQKGASILWLIFFGALLSIIASPLSSYPIAYGRLIQLLTPILFFCSLAHQGDPKRLTQTVLASLVAAAAFQSIIALAQYFEQGYLGLHFLGEPRTPTGIIKVESGRKWFFDLLSQQSNLKKIIIRSSGTMPHCNALGGFLCVSILAAYSLLFSSTKKWLKVLLFSAIALILMGICVTFSRAALFGWVIGTITWFGYAVYQKGFKQFRDDRRYSVLATAILFATLLTSLFFHEQVISRGGIVSSSSISQKSNDERIQFQNVSIEMIRKRPLLGWGYSQYSLGAAHHLKSFEKKPMEVHNIYLLLATETGVICALLFILFLSLSLLHAIRMPFTPEIASLASMFLAFLFIGGCDLYPIFSQNGRLILFGLAGLIASYRKSTLTQLNKNESWKIFDTISPHYDVINKILSFKMDSGWRKSVSRFLPLNQPLHILDLATGTGDQILSLFRSKTTIASATGIDLSSEMLEIAKKKANQTSWNHKMNWRLADAGHLPFPASHFDATTCSFGIRNFPDPLQSLKEMHRVLKTGGTCMVLEFSLPPAPFKWVYLFYLRTILPFLGGLISKEPAAYRYLNETIETFPSGEDFCALMKQAQFSKAKAHKMALGAVTLYIGIKS